MVSVRILSVDPAAVNSGIVIGRHRSLLVDSGPGPDAAGALVARTVALQEEELDISNPFDLVLTHDHWDHWFGAATIAAAGARTVWASEAFAHDQEANSWIALDALRTEASTAGFAQALPEDPAELVTAVAPIVSPQTLDLGAVSAELHVLAGHSTSDVVVRLPELGIVFTGDLVEESGPPQAGTDASLGEWVASLRTLLSFSEATVFVPGHGVPVDRAFVSRQLADLEGYRADPSDAEVALPARAMPGSPSRALPRELRLV